MVVNPAANGTVTVSLPALSDDGMTVGPRVVSVPQATTWFIPLICQRVRLDGGPDLHRHARHRPGRRRHVPRLVTTPPAAKEGSMAAQTYTMQSPSHAGGGDRRQGPRRHLRRPRAHRVRGRAVRLQRRHPDDRHPRPGAVRRPDRGHADRHHRRRLAVPDPAARVGVRRGDRRRRVRQRHHPHRRHRSVSPSSRCPGHEHARLPPGDRRWPVRSPTSSWSTCAPPGGCSKAEWEAAQEHAATQAAARPRPAKPAPSGKDK